MLFILVIVSPVAALLACAACRQPKTLFWLSGGALVLALLPVVLTAVEMGQRAAEQRTNGEEGWALMLIVFVWLFLGSSSAILLVGGLVRRERANRDGNRCQPDAGASMDKP